jgi:hypothetical protein
MNPLDDPLRNAWVGCLWPIARSVLIVGALFVLAIIVAAVAGDIDWMFFTLLAAIPILFLVQRFFPGDRERQKEALNRLLSVREEE